MPRIHMETTMKTISPRELFDLKQQDESIELIDVRTPLEFREVHVDFAENVPLDSLNVNELEKGRNGSAGKPLYVICRSGTRGSKACQKFVNAGLDHVVNVEGGTSAWDEAGLPVVRGKKAMSLERQVRIAAGFLVLVGVILGFAIHPALFGISGFVGAGLMFAGITDTCAMGMLIAKMPWNQVKTDCAVKPSA